MLFWRELVFEGGIVEKRIKAAARMCSSKQTFLKILQYSQENTCVGVFFFFLKLHAWKSATLLKWDSSTGVFLWIFRSFQEQLFWQNTSGCYVWKDGMKLSIIIVQPFNAWWPLKGHTFLNKSTAESMYDL